MVYSVIQKLIEFAGNFPVVKLKVLKQLSSDKHITTKDMFH